MGVLDRIKDQFQVEIEWLESRPINIFWCWSNDPEEIKKAKSILIEPGQGILFICEGNVRSMLVDQGEYDLAKENLSFWGTVLDFIEKGYSDVSICYFRQGIISKQKWGTKEPVKNINPKDRTKRFLKAYGTYAFRVVNPARLYSNVVKDNAFFPISEFNLILREKMLLELSRYLSKENILKSELESKFESHLKPFVGNMKREFVDLGVEIGKMGLLGGELVDNLDLTDETDELDVEDIVEEKSPYETLRMLKKMSEESLLSREEYVEKRAEVLKRL